MIVVKLMGGIGNQLFQYFLYESLSALNYETYLDISHFELIKDHGGHSITTLLETNSEKIIDSSHELYKKIKNYARRGRFKKFIKTNYNYHFIEKKYDYSWNINRLKLLIDQPTITYVEGYFQDNKYFYNIDPQKLLEPLFSKLEIDQDYLINLRNSNSISLHIRRGDYIGSNSELRIIDKDYIEKAINLIIDRTGLDYTIHVFSDDITWCRNSLGFIKNEILYVEKNSGLDSINDIYLMSLCNHNIISASTFSWWGAYLNSNEDKIVVAPRFFYNSNFRFKENYGLKKPDWFYL